MKKFKDMPSNKKKKLTQLAVFLVLIIIYLCVTHFIKKRSNLPFDKSLYEKKTYDYAYTHNEIKRKKDIDEARYFQDSDGVYVSSGGDNSKKARIMLTGDVMCQTKQQKRASKNNKFFDFDGSFSYLKDIFKKADLVAGNLETCISHSASYMMEEPEIDGKPHLNAPSTYLEALRYAGFDLLVNANNHNCDTGITGIVETIYYQDKFNFIHTGLFDDVNDKRYVIADINGIKVAFLSYATYFNKKDQNFTEQGVDIFLNKYSEDRIKKDITDAKTDGAEFIISYIHWGNEKKQTVNDKQKRIAKEMADAGVDIIAGSHPHVLQEMDYIESADGRTVPVFYSLGNFISHMTEPENVSDAIILDIYLEKNEDGSVSLSDMDYIPCRCMKEYEGRGYIVAPITIERRKDINSEGAFSDTYNREVELFFGMLDVNDEYR